MKKVKHIILRALTDGLSTRRVSLALAIGLSMGIFPIYGPVSMLCVLLAWVTRLNMPVMLGGVYAMALIKPLLILPFLRLGEWMFRADPMGISLVELSRRFSETPLSTLQAFSWSFLHAIAGWLAVLPLLIPLFYYTSKPIVLGIDRIRISRQQAV